MKLCAKCKKLQAAEFAAAYASRVASGLCGRCGAKPVRGRKKCEACMAQERTRSREYYARKKGNAS